MRAIAPRPRPGSAFEAPRGAAQPDETAKADIAALKARVAAAEATVATLTVEQGKHSASLDTLSRDLETVKATPRDAEKPEVVR